MKYIYFATIFIVTLSLGKEEGIENKYLYFSNGSLSNIDISCKKDDDCMLTRSLHMGCSHFIAVNKKLTQKDIKAFNAKEGIFWITKDIECAYPSKEQLKKFKAVCVGNVCGLSDGKAAYLQSSLSCGMDEKLRNLEEKKKLISTTEYKKRFEQRHQSLMWKKLKHGLWMNNFGDIGLKTSKALNEDVMVDIYITTMGAEEKKLKDVLDIETFERVGGLSYYRDKNYVYMHYGMSSGGWFGIVEGADSASFRSMGSVYAKDKKYIYVERNGKIDVDYDTFEVFETVGDVCCYAKDKHNYYAWGEKITDTKSSEFLKIKKILDRQSVMKKKRLPECTPELIEQHVQDEMKRYGIEKKLTSQPPCLHSLMGIE